MNDRTRYRIYVRETNYYEEPGGPLVEVWDLRLEHIAGPELPLLSGGQLYFNLTAGTTQEEAQRIASAFNARIESVEYYPN